MLKLPLSDAAEHYVRIGHRLNHSNVEEANMSLSLFSLVPKQLFFGHNFIDKPFQLLQ